MQYFFWSSHDGLLSVVVKKKEVEADQYIMKYPQSIWTLEETLNQSNMRIHLINNYSLVPFPWDSSNEIFKGSETAWQDVCLTISQPGKCTVLQKPDVGTSIQRFLES